MANEPLVSSWATCAHGPRSYQAVLRLIAVKENGG